MPAPTCACAQAPSPAIRAAPAPHVVPSHSLCSPQSLSAATEATHHGNLSWAISKKGAQAPTHCLGHSQAWLLCSCWGAQHCSHLRSAKPRAHSHCCSHLGCPQPPEIKCKLGWGGSWSPYMKPTLLGLHAAASKSACKNQSTKSTLGRAGNLGLIPFAIDRCPCKPFPATRQAPPASHPPVHASSPLQNRPRGTGVAPSEQHALVQKERGSVPPAGPLHPWGGTAAGCVALQSTPIRIDLLRFNSLIFFPRSRAAFPQVPGVKLSVLDARKKKGGEKVKHSREKTHNTTKQKTPTTNYIPSGKTQSTTYTTSLLALLFIAQLKHLFLRRATRSSRVSVSCSERCASSALTRGCCWAPGTGWHPPSLWHPRASPRAASCSTWGS